MKWMLFLFGLSIVFSCSNDFELVEDRKDIPIVYGVIAASDTAHYIRVEKAFVDRSTPAAEIAQIPDSIYYENAKVSLRHIDSGEIFQLERIDGNLDGFVREDGVFASSPNYLYKIKAQDIQLQQGDTYELEIDRGIENLPLVTAQTLVISETQFRTPNPASQSILNFEYPQFTTFSWRTNDATIYDMFLNFNYRERRMGSGDPFEPKAVSWKVFSEVEATKADVQGQEFYTFLAGAITNDPEMERVFVNIELQLDCGGQEIQEFIRVSDANLGITSSQDVPVFSNLSEGRGLFSSKYTVSFEGITLSNKSLDSLRMGIFTSQLNFQ